MRRANTVKIPKGVLPAIRRMKDFDRILQSNHDTVIFLETRLAQLKSLVDYTRRANKKTLIHFDLIQGLTPDEYGMEYLIRNIKPYGILSTRGNVIKLAKKNGLLAIQRMFLLDSLALEQNIKLSKRFQPDCIEVLPGVIPNIIEEIYEQTTIPIIAGGLVRSAEEVNEAFRAGAIAVTTSNPELWE